MSSTLQATAPSHSQTRVERLYFFRWPLCLIALLTLSACGTEDADTSSPAATTPPHQTPQEASAVTTLHSNATVKRFLSEAKAAFVQARNAGAQLSEKTRTFIQSPTEDNMAILRDQWLRSHDAWANTSLFRNIALHDPALYQTQTAPTVIHPVTIRLDQFPLLPGYLDEVQNYPKTGLIHSDLPLTFEALNREHQFSDPAYVAIGFHAMEFMLWGEAHQADHQQRARYAPADLKTKEVPLPEPEIVARRKQYLQFLADQIESDMNLVYATWTQEGSFYPSSLNQMPADRALKLIKQAIDTEASLLASEYSQDSLHSFRGTESQNSREAIYLRLAKDLVR